MFSPDLKTLEYCSGFGQGSTGACNSRGHVVSGHDACVVVDAVTMPDTPARTKHVQRGAGGLGGGSDAVLSRRAAQGRARSRASGVGCRLPGIAEGTRSKVLAASVFSLAEPAGGDAEAVRAAVRAVMT